MRRGVRPRGIPIGRALDIPAGIAYDDLREVVAAIDRIHGDGELPRIPVRLATGITHLGRFRYQPQTGEPTGITIRTDQRHRQLTLSHEIGHFLDWIGLGAGERFASQSSAHLQGWVESVSESEAFKHLDDLARRGVGKIDGDRIVVMTSSQVSATRASLRLEELWARSYAQYVARTSGLTQMNLSMGVFRHREVDRVYYPLQWEDDDFAQIHTSIDELFFSLGWRQ